ncbi:MAG: mandelate racemase [Oxalobacteraceae bacterium]|nr:mandelate racemase [Oxalobacteraceae bacterium]
MNSLTITDIRARAVVAPLARPVRTASGSVDVSPLILLDVVTDQGITGHAYLFGYTPVTLKPLLSLLEQIKPELVGKTCVPLARMQQMEKRFRLLGLQGLLGMLLSTLDMAYWDALGKAANQPVVQLLGGEARPIAAYDSYGMVDPVKDAKAIEHTLKQGFKAIKIKLGDADAQRDLHVVAEVRRIIGPEITLMVDYNQSLSPKEAIRRIRMIEPHDIHWVEEPVAAEDLQGHARVREAVNLGIQTGENWWFPRDAERALSAGACDMMMPDLMKIGGITGWLSVVGIANAASMPVSSHIFIEASAHVLPVTPTCHWLEFMDFGSMILAEPYEINQGTVTAKGPGLGMSWNETAVERYAVN